MPTAGQGIIDLLSKLDEASVFALSRTVTQGLKRCNTIEGLCTFLCIFLVCYLINVFFFSHIKVGIYLLSNVLCFYTSKWGFSWWNFALTFEAKLEEFIKSACSESNWHNLRVGHLKYSKNDTK